MEPGPVSRLLSVTPSTWPMAWHTVDAQETHGEMLAPLAGQLLSTLHAQLL